MKFIQVTIAALACFTSVIAAPTQSSTVTIPSYLGRPVTVYRAITRDLVSTVSSDYVVGRSPRGGTMDPGDFVPRDRSGIHVFVNPLEAQFYAQCYASISKAPTYVVTMAYTPSSSASVKSFTTNDLEWKAFVNKAPHNFDIVEGPYSGAGGKVGMEQATPGGKVLWQGAFIGQRGLSTLKVAKVERVNVPGSGSRRCCELIPGCVVS